MQFVSILVSFFSSIIGAICGIGGGVIIKPVMDAVTEYSAATVSFLSGITVLCMTSYSIGRNLISHNSQVRLKIATLLGIGAAAGGVAGKILFEMIKQSFGDGHTLGAIQAITLFAVTLGTLLYSLFKKKIKTKNVLNPAFMILIGILLGMMSSFLGIGGGPINLVVLYYLFSMETKEAAQNSLYIIFISQIAGTIYSFISGSIPANIPLDLLLFMAAGGIAGGIVGRMINHRISSRVVERLFIGLQIVICGICLYNFFAA